VQNGSISGLSLIWIPKDAHTNIRTQLEAHTAGTIGPERRASLCNFAQYWKLADFVPGDGVAESEFLLQAWQNHRGIPFIFGQPARGGPM
jgi:hypothetical protein